MIWKYQLVNEKGELISRHKTKESAMKAQKYCKSTSKSRIKPI